MTTELFLTCATSKKTTRPTRNCLTYELLQYIHKVISDQKVARIRSWPELSHFTLNAMPA